MTRLEELIALAAASMKFGQLALSLEVHDGQVKALEGNEHMQKFYTGDGTQPAVDQALALLAQERNDGKSGQITFTFDFKSGQVKKLFVHRQFKHQLTE